MIENWKYYNHALVPTTAPHENPDLAAIQNKDIWNVDGKNVLFIRYTTDFDIQEETEFWYIIKEGPFLLSELEKKYRKHVEKAIERCEARKIDAKDYLEQIWEVTKAAYSKYDNADNELTEDLFKRAVLADTDNYWGAFSRETGEMAGWMSCQNNGSYTETKKAKYHPELQSFNRPSDVLHYAVLNYYLNDLGQKYVCSGTRNINHKTHVQDYKIKNWNFRKAYCKLHIIYNPKIKWIVKIAYPFRKLLKLFDSITLIHQVNSLMILEDIVRRGD